jgi:uncharacterized glyoxalase superfamily metalloenzyme YdcJ
VTALKESFSAFPDEWEELRAKELAFFEYTLTDKGVSVSNAGGVEGHFDALIADGYIEATPILYEDFLPVSAAGIFRSNLKTDQNDNFEGKTNQSLFETQLGAKTIDSFDLYRDQQASSKEHCLKQLRVLDKTSS